MKVPTGQQLKILTLMAAGRELTAVDIMTRDPSIGEGTIYPALMRLERKGFLTSRKEHVTEEPGAPRRYYKITGLGVRAQRLGALAEAIEPDSGPVRVPGGAI